MAKKIAKPCRATCAAPGSLVFEREGRAVWQGDCLTWLAAQEPGRFSACVTDPPYELGFMGRKWDKSGVSFDPETWRAVLCALRPGAHLVAFGGTRTFHRIACAIEDGGFEIRDCLMWMYSTGLPKGLDVSKAIDKMKGVTRRIIGRRKGRKNTGTGRLNWNNPNDHKDRSYFDITAPATPEAIHWQGWNTSLKPTWEPIILARKPFNSTLTKCVLKYGTGALNIDVCRLKTINDAIPDRCPPNSIFQHDQQCSQITEEIWACVPGCQVRILDKQSNSAARFFYCPKTSAAERHAGLSMLEDNTHLTIKPVTLMEWLLRLVAPPGGEVLDPFAGSGSTLVAAKRLGIPAVGIDLDAEACETAAARLTRRTAKGLGGTKKLKLGKRRRRK